MMTMEQRNSSGSGQDDDQTDVVFIVCSERSGSNLIRAMLDAHSKIHAPMPVHVGRTFAKKLHTYGDLSDDGAWRSLIRDALRQVTGAKGRLEVELTEDELFSNVSERSYCALYRYIYARSLAQAGKSILAIKEVHTHRDLGFYLSCFPNAKFVMQVRDPRDYALSCIKTGRFITHYGSTVQALDVWMEDQQSALNMMASLGPHRMRAHRYEDLVTDPARVLTELCSFIGIAYEPEMLAFNERASAKDAAKRHPTYWGNLAKPVLSDNVAKYKNGLGQTTIAAVEQRTKPLMERFAYELESPRLNVLNRIGLAFFPVTNWGGLFKQWLRNHTIKRWTKRKKSVGRTTAAPNAAAP